MDREASPTAVIIDRQTAKSAEKGWLRSILRGYDAGKETKGPKRHIVVDAEGLLLNAVVHSAGARTYFRLARGAADAWPRISKSVAETAVAYIRWP